MAATVKDTWYRIRTPGKGDQVVKAGSAAHQKAAEDGSPGRPQVSKVISPGVYPQARIVAAGLPDNAWTDDNPKAKPKAKKKGADKAAPKGEDK